MKKKTRLRSVGCFREIGSGLRRCEVEAVQVAEAIAELAEPALEEYESSKVLEEFLARNGFRVSRPWKNLPTAFRAVAGRGRPRIALLAEYDALPDCGPGPGQWGHGCGHNLLGTASGLGGIIAAEVLRKLSREGTVLVFGTPAEEALSGKVMLCEHNAFANLDAVLTWHPHRGTRVNLAGGAAMDSIVFSFRGKTAHAGGAPHEGRSALDAALLTDVAVNYLREHIPDNVRIHSVIPDGGGVPNVVPDRAKIWYYVRGRDRKQVDEMRRRVTACARGAALATETRVRTTVVDSVTERIPNRTLAQMLDALLHRCGPPRFTPPDTRAAAKISLGKKYSTKIAPIQSEPHTASSDEDNVSWFVPLGQFLVACVPEGTVGHHREYARMIRTSGAHRGMKKAAQVLAGATLELVLNRPLLEKARAEFRKNRRGKRYNLPLTRASHKPPKPARR